MCALQPPAMPAYWALERRQCATEELNLEFSLVFIHLNSNTWLLDIRMREKMCGLAMGKGSRSGILWSSQEANLELTGGKLMLVTWRSSCRSIWVAVCVGSMLPPTSSGSLGRPCARWLLGAHSGVQGSPSTDLVMELEGPSVRSSPAIWNLFLCIPAVGGGPYPLCGVICGLSGLRIISLAMLRVGRCPFSCPPHSLGYAGTCSPKSWEQQSSYRKPQAPGRWGREMQREGATSHITLRWSLASTGQLPLTSHLPHGLILMKKWVAPGWHLTATAGYKWLSCSEYFAGGGGNERCSVHLSPVWLSGHWDTKLTPDNTDAILLEPEHGSELCLCKQESQRFPSKY